MRLNIIKQETCKDLNKQWKQVPDTHTYTHTLDAYTQQHQRHNREEPKKRPSQCTQSTGTETEVKMKTEPVAD